MDKFLNLAIVAHVDAGKTSLTENLLHNVGIIENVGRVDSGNTQTDNLEIERKRGITIKSSPISFYISDLKVNLIDTPGHMDFISEVERSLNIIDGAILVISSVEGVQPQTKVIYNLLRNMKVPILIFLNKVDRAGSNYHDVLINLTKLYDLDLKTLNTIKNEGLGNVSEAIRLEKKPVIKKRNRNSDFSLFNNQETPVIVGSAIKSIGTKTLIEAIYEQFPHTLVDNNAKLSGIVFKVESTKGRKKVFFRVFKGRLVNGKRIQVENEMLGKREIKIDSVFNLSNGESKKVEVIMSGDVGYFFSNSNVIIGDILGEYTSFIKHIPYSAPTLEYLVSINKANMISLIEALKFIQDENPSIKISPPKENFLKLSLFGEIQKEYINYILNEELDLNVSFNEPQIIYIEKPIKKSSHNINMGDSENAHLATIGLEIIPTNSNKIEFSISTEKGIMPKSFYNAIEESVYSALERGIYGWRVEGIQVRVTNVGFKSPDSTAADFRELTIQVLATALKKCGTELYEPFSYFNIYVDRSSMNRLLSVLYSMKILDIEIEDTEDTVIIKGLIAFENVRRMNTLVKDLTNGEGIMISEPHSFRKINGLESSPTR